MSEFDRESVFKTLTIASGATTSDAVRARPYTRYGLVMPTAFTGTAVSFTVSAEPDAPGGATYQALYDITNTIVSLTVAASRSYDLPEELTSWPAWKIVSNGAEGAARTLVVVAKG